MPRVPDADTHRREFAALPFGRRRQVVSAVNRGRAVEDPKLAGHAVIVARRQARLWKYAWLLGPAVGAFRLLDSLAAAIVSASVSTFILGLMSWWWYSRAVRAEQENFALTTEGKRAARKASKGKASEGKASQHPDATGGGKSRSGPRTGKAARGGHTPRSSTKGR